MAREERDQQRLRGSFGPSVENEAQKRLETAPPPAKPLPDGAHRRLSRAQVIGLSALIVGVLTLIAIDPHGTFEGFHLLFFVGFMGSSAIKLVAAFTPRKASAAAPLSDEMLPAYTVIVPLYREAGVAAELIANLAKLNYPRDRLQVLIVLEAKDHETQAAFADLDLPAGFQVLIAAPGSPQTKPRACNVALDRANGDLVVIYDAEDAPHPGQLREAAARFAVADDALACLQAPLRIEPDPRFVPDQFALEYAVLFEILLPAFARWSLPFPLGGTSNHFRASELRAVGGWDPYNVTEDADIGFRLAARGRRLDVMARPTFETAPTRWKVWKPQRARWIKGHLQTLAVHMRGEAVRTPRGAAALVLTLALPVVSSHLHGPMLLWLVAQSAGSAFDLCPAVHAMDWMLVFFGWTCVAIAGSEAQRRAGHRQRALPLLGAIAYWPLQSLAAIEALRQFVVSPFHWDKTPHAPRSANPWRLHLLARTGRALP